MSGRYFAGFDFCDSQRTGVDPVWLANQQAAESQFSSHEELVDEGVASSSCDRDQTIGR